MSRTLQIPDIRRVLEKFERRISILERRITETPSTPQGNDDIIFSYPGVLLSGEESPPVKVRYNGVIDTLAIALGTAGTASTIIKLKRNGTVVATLTVPLGVSDYVPSVGVRVSGEDRLSLRVDTAGSGAVDLTAMARFA